MLLRGGVLCYTRAFSCCNALHAMYISTLPTLSFYRRKCKDSLDFTGYAPTARTLMFKEVHCNTLLRSINTTSTTEHYQVCPV